MSNDSIHNDAMPNEAPAQVGRDHGLRSKILTAIDSFLRGISTDKSGSRPAWFLFTSRGESGQSHSSLPD
jgi:hypothetical protein